MEPTEKKTGTVVLRKITKLSPYLQSIDRTSTGHSFCDNSGSDIMLQKFLWLAKLNTLDVFDEKEEGSNSGFGTITHEGDKYEMNLLFYNIDSFSKNSFTFYLKSNSSNQQYLSVTVNVPQEKLKEYSKLRNDIIHQNVQTYIKQKIMTNQTRAGTDYYEETLPFNGYGSKLEILDLNQIFGQSRKMKLTKLFDLDSVLNSFPKETCNKIKVAKKYLEKKGYSLIECKYSLDKSVPYNNHEASIKAFQYRIGFTNENKQKICLDGSITHGLQKDLSIKTNDKCPVKELEEFLRKVSENQKRKCLGIFWF